MRYKSFYQLIQVDIKKGDTIYPDIVFTPTRQTAELLQRSNLQPVTGEGKLSLFYKAYYDALPAEGTKQKISFNSEHVYFTFKTENTFVVDAISGAAPPQAGTNPLRSVFTLTDVQDINGALHAVRSNKYPGVFTHTVTAGTGVKQFRIFKDGVEIAEDAIYERTVTSDDDGNYNCTADLTNCPAGFYELQLQDIDPYVVYVDTQNELPGQTGLLELVLTDYNYTSSSNSSPPVFPVQSAISIHYNI